ncbi:hypothetical protein K1T71_006773 [Dendrolimus kikuchii]|uniref:Uncharacterized protein n=1 Tax=Dendrolimus kikuchii TaxID=765133 RepID=A0ACC1D1Y6_9NEOP|nr:hypothetical protein K1T71_006773 [Dendrolimus kikuchii]
MIARDVKFHESPNTRKDISKQEPSLLNITKDDDQDFIEIDFTKSNVPVEKRRHEAEEVDNMQDIWSECQEYPAEYDRDESSSRRLQAEQQAEETRHDALDQLRMTTRAPGRPRILRTGSVGRPKKIYQTREVERSVTSTDANEVEDFAGSTEITLKNALKNFVMDIYKTSTCLAMYHIISKNEMEYCVDAEVNFSHSNPGLNSLRLNMKIMSPSILFVALFVLPLLSGISSNKDERRWLVSLMGLVEFDYEDHCEQRANAAWNELIGDNTGLAMKLERDKAFGMFSHQQTKEIQVALTVHALDQNDDVLRRKVKLLLQPGDTLLDIEQWIRLVTFGDTALNKIRFATNYDCGTSTNCTLREFHYNFARQQDEETLQRMKLSWEKNLPDLHDYLEHILPLLRNASKHNNYNSVEEYWDALGEYEAGTLKARELWGNIKYLYLKLHKYVALKLKGADAVGKPLPAHLLRSLNGDDWSNLIESLLPKHAGIYQKIHANLQLKELGGIKAFKQAEELLKALNLGEIDSETFTHSVFNSTCPTTLVDWCKPNKMRVVTCKDVSIGNYIEAHESLMKIKYKQIINLHSNNTYALREAPRYSAIYEAIPGFASLLSINPHALNRAKLYPLETFNYNQNHHRLVLQLIMALRDLPKLNYYLAADEWRIKVLMGSIPYSKIPSSWSEFRKNFSLIESSHADLLGDPYVVFNKPFIGKFMGIILKYQIYQSFAEELISDDSDLVQHIAENNGRLVDTMMQGYGELWPEMVSELLAKRENGLEYTGLTDYYRLLDEYLDHQLDPTLETEYTDDYIDAPEPTPEDNDIPTSDENSKENTKAPEKETHENIIENEIDTGDETMNKFGVETSTVGVLEIKNPVAAGDQTDGVNTKEASYNTYWWIGIAVAIAVVVILIAIIARKRHGHRKQLERQRAVSTA